MDANSVDCSILGGTWGFLKKYMHIIDQEQAYTFQQLDFYCCILECLISLLMEVPSNPNFGLTPQASTIIREGYYCVNAP